MCKRILALVMLVSIAQVAVADVGNTNPNDLVGIFEYNQDIGSPEGIGFTMDMGIGITPGLGDSREYLLTGSGADVWGNWDEFHMAYNLVSGDVRVTSDFDWVAARNGWAKYGVMLRGSDAGDAVHFSTLTRKNEDLIRQGRRFDIGGGSSDAGFNMDTSNTTMSVQRITSGGITVIQSLIDRNEGAGWEVIATNVNPNLPDEILAGVFITSHDDTGLAQVKAYNVKYESENIDLIGVTTVDGTIDQCSDIPGFKLRTKKRDLAQTEWGYNEAIKLLNGDYVGDVLDWDLLGQPGFSPLEATRVDPIVNLNQDDSDIGAFGDDSHFPGIDLVKEKGVFPDDNDDDNDFAVEVIACIYLTEGLHIIGANGDDGTIVEIGGVEIGRAAEWKGSSNVDFLFDVAAEGFYSFKATHLGGGGGENLELHEVLADGTRILLGATDEQGAFIGSPVYAPEPATIALLGLGGLSLLRRKRS